MTFFCCSLIAFSASCSLLAAYKNISLIGRDLPLVTLYTLHTHTHSLSLSVTHVCLHLLPWIHSCYTRSILTIPYYPYHKYIIIMYSSLIGYGLCTCTCKLPWKQIQTILTSDNLFPSLSSCSWQAFCTTHLSQGERSWW